MSGTDDNEGPVFGTFGNVHNDDLPGGVRAPELDREIQQLKKDVLDSQAVDPAKEDAELEAKLERAIKIAKKQRDKHSLNSFSHGSSQDGIINAILAAAVLAKMK